MARISDETVRQLARAADIRPDEAELGTMAELLEGLLVAIERCEELNLSEHEPANRFGLSGGATDAEL